jgi:hypothetical protein
MGEIGIAKIHDILGFVIEHLMRDIVQLYAGAVVCVKQVVDLADGQVIQILALNIIPESLEAVVDEQGAGRHKRSQKMLVERNGAEKAGSGSLLMSKRTPLFSLEPGLDVPAGIQERKMTPAINDNAKTRRNNKCLFIGNPS